MKRKNAVVVSLLLSTLMLTGCTTVVNWISDAVDYFAPAESEVIYDDLVEHWKNDIVFEGSGAEEALNTILSAAEEGDRDKLVNCFTEELRDTSSFQDQVDAFLKAYPKGLLGNEMEYRPAGAGGSINGNNVIKGAGAIYTCDYNGDHYRIWLKFCFVNDEDPDKIGVEFCLIQNDGAIAKSNSESAKYSEEDYWEGVIICCDIRNDVNYRMIAGSPLCWTETDSPKLTVDEMRALLSTYRDLGNPAVREAIGEPNYAIKFFNSTGYWIYYELMPENGEARYAFISAESPTGSIYDAYVSTAESTDYDNPLCPFIRPG